MELDKIRFAKEVQMADWGPVDDAKLSMAQDSIPNALLAE